MLNLRLVDAQWNFQYKVQRNVDANMTSGNTQEQEGQNRICKDSSDRRMFTCVQIAVIPKQFMQYF